MEAKGSPTRGSPGGGSGPTEGAGRGALALALQEVLTVIARIRADRQVAEDGRSFRAHVKQLLGRADQEGRAAGYDDEYVRLAVYATVAFLDESVLNSPRPMFQDWAGQPLQEEVFGDHMAGETFYRYLDDLLVRQDSEELADCLEVFQLCLLLGFRGRYGGAGAAERDTRMRSVQEKIQRIRGPHGPMAPAGTLPENDQHVAPSDPWVRRLALTALASVLVVLAAFGLFTLGLGPGLEEVQSLATRIAG